MKLKILERIFRKGKLPIFIGPYKDIKIFSKAYSNIRYEDIDHHLKVIGNIRSTDFVFQTRQQLLNLYVHQRFKNLTILDIGGGSNSVIHNLKYLGISAEVYCLETDSFLKARKMRQFESDVKFVKIEDLNGIGVDVAYFGSSIQYFHSLHEVKRIIQCVKPKVVIIGGTILINNPELEGIYAQPRSDGQFQAYTVRTRCSLANFFESIEFKREIEIPEAEVQVRLPKLERLPTAYFQIYERR